jgi:curli biogenesis system outer membrane secretion channel CsgG
LSSSDKNKIAVVNISGVNSSDADFLIDELNRLLVNSMEFTIVDRKSLDAVRTEQDFQLSGEVDDEQIVGIGKMAGANIVITGNIQTRGKTSRLILKATNVKTAEIVAMSSEIIK